MIPIMETCFFEADAVLKDGLYTFTPTASSDLPALSGAIKFADDGITTLTYTAESDPFLYFEDDSIPRVTFSYPDYPNLEVSLSLPTVFKETTQEDAANAWRNMPFFEQELSLPVPQVFTAEDLEAILGPPEEIVFDADSNNLEFLFRDFTIHAFVFENSAGQTTYGIEYFESCNPDCAPSVRDIKIGSSADEVLSRFPNAAGAYNTLIANPRAKYYLYGMEVLNYPYGVVCSGRDHYIAYVLSDATIRFYLDENGIVTRILYFRFV